MLHLAGGHLQIVSEAAQGTTVQVRVPLSSPLPSDRAAALRHPSRPRPASLSTP